MNYHYRNVLFDQKYHKKHSGDYVYVFRDFPDRMKSDRKFVNEIIEEYPHILRML